MVRKYTRTMLASAAFAALSTGLVGCAGPGSTSADVNLGVEKDMWAYQEARTAECMQSNGFDYVQRAAPANEGNLEFQSPYNLTLDEAKQRGFGYVDEIVAGLNAATDPMDPNQGYRDQLASEKQIAFDHALEGDPRGDKLGCRASAREASVQEYGSQIETLVGSSDTLAALVASPRYVKFETSWATCMSDAGYPTSGFEEFHRGWVLKASNIVSSSESNGGDIRQSLAREAAQKVRGEEIAAAVTNMGCLKPLESEFNALVDEVARR